MHQLPESKEILIPKKSTSKKNIKFHKSLRKEQEQINNLQSCFAGLIQKEEYKSNEKVIALAKLLKSIPHAKNVAPDTEPFTPIQKKALIDLVKELAELKKEGGKKNAFDYPSLREFNETLKQPSKPKVEFILAFSTLNIIEDSLTEESSLKELEQVLEYLKKLQQDLLTFDFRLILVPYTGYYSYYDYLFTPDEEDECESNPRFHPKNIKALENKIHQSCKKIWEKVFPEADHASALFLQSFDYSVFEKEERHKLLKKLYRNVIQAKKAQNKKEAHEKAKELICYIRNFSAKFSTRKLNTSSLLLTGEKTETSTGPSEKKIDRPLSPAAQKSLTPFIEESVELSLTTSQQEAKKEIDDPSSLEDLYSLDDLYALFEKHCRNPSKPKKRSAINGTIEEFDFFFTLLTQLMSKSKADYYTLAHIRDWDNKALKGALQLMFPKEDADRIEQATIEIRSGVKIELNASSPPSTRSNSPGLERLSLATRSSSFDPHSSPPLAHLRVRRIRSSSFLGIANGSKDALCRTISSESVRSLGSESSDSSLLSSSSTFFESPYSTPAPSPASTPPCTPPPPAPTRLARSRGLNLPSLSRIEFSSSDSLFSSSNLNSDSPPTSPSGFFKSRENSFSAESSDTSSNSSALPNLLNKGVPPLT